MGLGLVPGRLTAELPALLRHARWDCWPRGSPRGLIGVGPGAWPSQRPGLAAAGPRVALVRWDGRARLAPEAGLGHPWLRLCPCLGPCLVPRLGLQVVRLDILCLRLEVGRLVDSGSSGIRPQSVPSCCRNCTSSMDMPGRCGRGRRSSSTLLGHFPVGRLLEPQLRLSPACPAPTRIRGCRSSVRLRVDRCLWLVLE